MKKVKYLLIAFSAIIIALLLIFSIKNYSFEVKTTVEKQSNPGGAVVKITSSEEMKVLKIYKKASNNKFILFYIGKVSGKEIKVTIPTSALSYEARTDIKVVAINEKGERGNGEATIDKLDPPASMNPEETAKPSWSPSPIPTKPTTTPTPSASAEPSQSSTPTPTPETSPTPDQPIDLQPGVSKQKYEGMNYYLMIPDEPVENMPIIVFLHGDGESANFTSLEGLPIYKYVKTKKAYEAGKFIFIMPHQNKRSWTGDSTVNSLMAIIEKVATDCKANKNRIVLTGMSRGGMGTWTISNKYPNYFAAIVPMSGSASINANNYINTPVWAIAGTRGDEVSYGKNMEKNVNAINQASGKKLAKMERINGAAHNTIQQSYQRIELFKWMLGQNKNPSAPNTSSNTTANNAPLSVAPGTTVQNYNGMNYVQVIPDNPTENMPLIVFLHGSGERGSVGGVQNLPITSYVSSKQAFQAGKFMFIAPVMNSGNWVDGGNANAAMALIEKVADQYKIDKNRIILTGMSNGGHGVWYLGATYPNYFAAIVPMSGYYNVNPGKLANMPIWAISGSAGELEVYFRPLMTNLVNQINATSGKKLAKMEVITGAYHETIQQSYKRLELFKWMLEQHK